MKDRFLFAGVVVTGVIALMSAAILQVRRDDARRALNQEQINQSKAEIASIMSIITNNMTRTTNFTTSSLHIKHSCFNRPLKIHHCYAATVRWGTNEIRIPSGTDIEIAFEGGAK